MCREHHEAVMARSTQAKLHDIGSGIALAESECPELVEIHLLDNLGLAMAS